MEDYGGNDLWKRRVFSLEMCVLSVEPLFDELKASAGVKRIVLWFSNTPKCVSCLGSAPDRAWGAHDYFPDPLVSSRLGRRGHSSYPTSVDAFGPSISGSRAMQCPKIFYSDVKRGQNIFPTTAPTRTPSVSPSPPPWRRG